MYRLHPTNKPFAAPSKHRRCTTHNSFRHRRKPLPPCAAQQIDLADNAVALTPSRGGVRGVVHFLGGAFVGAAPYLAYSALVDQLADCGYTVVLTPYQTTFQHDRCARLLHAAFLRAIKELPRWAAPPSAPIHGLGHSNGALMHAMMACLCTPTYTSNVLVSFNNRQVSDAVPLPLDPLRAVIQPVRGSGTLEALAQGAVGQLLAAAESAGGLVDAQTLRSLRQVAPAATQLGSVFDEVGDGTQDFTPSPDENRRLFAASYAVPRTLLLQFRDDAIDQTPALQESLRARGSALVVTREVLDGNHLTPVGISASWGRVPGVFGPAEALGQAALSLSQGDLRRMGRRVVEWMDACRYQR